MRPAIPDVDPSVPVLIVGAGPTGVTAATLLAQQGIRSLIVERHRDIYPLPRAVHLDDEVHRILQQLGVAEEFTAISRPAAGMRLVDSELRTMAQLTRDQAGGHNGWPEANMFDQPELERLLRDNLRHHPLAELRGSTEVQSLSELDSERPIQAILRDTATGATTTVRAHAVLGCDGANSVVRQAIGSRFQDLGFQERWFVLDIRCPTPLDVWNGVHQLCDPRRAATFMQIGPDRYRWEFRLHDHETDTALAQPDALRELLRPWTRDIPFEALTVLRHAGYTFHARIADRWRRGRVLLLGDAAHTTPPFIGQGMGAGLRDAANLAWKLALVLSQGAHPRLLDTYESERKAHVTRLIRFAIAIGWALTGGQDKAAAVRRLLLTQLLRIPALTGAAGRSTTPRLPSSPLVQASRTLRRHALVGNLAPQPWVLDPQGRPCRFDALLGDTFSVLTTRPIDPALAAIARRLGSPVLDLRSGLDHEGTLTAWLHSHGAATVLLRPDRVVLAASPRRSRPGRLPGADIARTATTWLPLLPPGHTQPLPAQRV